PAAPPAPAPAPAAAPAPAPAPPPTRPAEPLRELTLGKPRSSRPVIEYPTSAAGGSGGSEADLDEIGNRCRVKADARGRAAAKLRGKEGGGGNGNGTAAEPDVAAWTGKWLDLYYFGNAPGAVRTADVAKMDELAGCLEAVAEALATAREVR